ncbi:MAG: tol-pal system-associated acyl-CoA thioesterase [Pseudomonadales bacterium]|nr:tol-pal system-associated acyl-CoA thioesterase [Pseudomonadales bacterium]
MSEFSIQVRVYLEDTDAGGIVYYVNYLKFMERARTEWLRSIGSEFEALYDEQRQFVVHSLETQYKKPARMDDELTITAAIEKLGRTYILFRQQVIKQAQVMCEAQVKVACVNAQTMKPAAIPAVLQQQLTP